MGNQPLYINQPSPSVQKSTRRKGLALALLAVASMFLGLSAPAWAVMNGNPAAPGEFPFVVAVEAFTSSGWTFVGAGVVLDPNTVLTVAHLVDGASATNRRIRAGVTCLEGGYVRDVASYNVHESYLSGPGTLANDIALVRLTEPLPIIPGQIESASLPVDDSNNYVATPVEIVGWGRTVDHGSSEQCLHKADSQVISVSEARHWTQDVPGLTVTEEHLPVDNPSQASAFCRGDAGSPVIVLDGARYVVAGLNSFGLTRGNRCALDRPSFATRTSSYLQWIAAKAGASLPLGGDEVDEDDELRISDESMPQDTNFFESDRHRSVNPRSR
jgi:secreted trypsin-like serine protease